MTDIEIHIILRQFALDKLLPIIDFSLGNGLDNIRFKVHTKKGLIAITDGHRNTLFKGEFSKSGLIEAKNLFNDIIEGIVLLQLILAEGVKQ